MLDIKYIRENPDKVKKGIAAKNEKSRVDDVLKFDEERREIIVQVEDLKAKRK
jgi:seryl-tRNA synthetase